MTTTVTAEDNAPKVLISQTGRKGDPGTNGTNGDGFNQVRKSLLDNPLCHLFKTNKLVETSAPTGTDSDITFTRASTATYVDRYGIVKTAAVDTIREEKDGFLIEEAGTNLAIYSEQLDNAAWTKSGAIINVNAQTAPNGSLTMDEFEVTSVGTTQGLSAPQFTSNGSSDTFSFFILKSLSNFDTLLYFRSSIGGGDIYAKITFNPFTGVVTESSNTEAYSVMDMGDYYRVSLTSSLIPAGLMRAHIRIITQPIGSKIAVWGAQLEQSTSATSYIPTVGSAVTRLADQALLPVLNNVVTKEFSICGIISNLSPVTTTGSKFIFRVPVVSGFLALSYNPNNKDRLFFRYDDGSTGVQSNVTATENIKYFVLTVDGSNVTININGTESSLSKIGDPSLLLANDVSFFGITGSAISNGNIKDFRIYDFVLNANEIEYLLP